MQKQQLPQDIKKQIQDFQIKLASAKLLQGALKSETMALYEKDLKKIKRNIDAYQYSIESEFFKTNLSIHKSQHKEFKQTYLRLEKNLSLIKNNIGNESLFSKRTKDTKNKDYNDRQVIINEGDNAQKESEQALKRIDQNLGEMDKRADDIILQMNRQIKKMDQTYDNLNDTQTTLKRAEEHLSYFGKQIYTDRLMICMIIVIALAIIVIIGLAIAGKTPKQSNLTVK